MHAQSVMPAKAAKDFNVRETSAKLLRHAGLVPASTLQDTLKPLISRHGGPRNKSEVTKVPG